MEAQAKHTIEKQSPRPTIGLLVTWLRDAYENSFMLGVAEAAEALDVNLICVVGGELRRDIPHNVIFELLKPQKFDGLIISGTLGHALSSETLQNFCADFAPLPLIGGALPVPGMVQVLPDGASGMREAVEHLVSVHACRRIAFIQGPAGQTEAVDRYRAYTEVLAQHNIPLDVALIVAGDYRRVTGAAAMEELLARAVDFDAVVAANDDMAFGAFDVLHKHGLRVPEDVALVGFDDVLAAQHLETPLTTVRQSLPAATRATMETLLAMIRGEQVPPAILIPTQLVVRQSCGCQLDVVGQAAVTLDAPVAAQLTVDTPAPPDVPETLWRAFLDDVTTGNSMYFLAACNLGLRSIQSEAQLLLTAQLARVTVWHTHLSNLRRTVLPYLTERTTLIHAENLLQQGRVLVSAALQRFEGEQRTLLHQQETHIQELGHTIAAALNLAELQAPVERYFPTLGIRHCYLVQYAAESRAREQVRLLFSYEQEQGARVWSDAALVSAYQLLPVGTALEQQRYTAVLTALVMRETQLGFMLFELGPHEGGLYERLSEQFSGSIFRMSMLQEQLAAQADLENSRQRAETALRDLMTLQQGYVHSAWEAHSGAVSGYMHTAELAGPTTTAWLPVMGSGAAAGQPVQLPLPSGHGLALPLLLHGELIGVLGLEREDEEPWDEQQIAVAQGLLEQTALALETHRLVAEMQRRAAQLRMATEVAQITSSILALDELLNRSVNLLQERFGYYYVGLFLVEETGRWAVLRAGSGEAGRIMLERGHKLEVGGTSMIGSCVTENEAQIALDVGAEAVRFNNPVLPDTHSELALPLRSRGRAIGAMSIQSTARAAFAEEDITVLQTVADQLGNAIENVRLLDEMEQTVRALKSAQGSYTQESWQAYMDTMGQETGYRYRLGFEPVAAIYPEAQTALEQQQSVITTYAATTGIESQGAAARTAMAVPVRLREQIIGALNVRFEDENVPAETLTLVEQIAEELAVALENARLYQTTQQQAAEERLIGDITTRMRERMDVAAVLQVAVRELQQALDLERVELRVGTPAEDSDDVQDVLRG